MKWSPVLIFLISITSFTACKKAASSDSAPVIGEIDLTPNTVRSGFGKDTVFVTFSVSDANADLGNDPYSRKFDVYVKDSRDNNETGFPFPEIPNELKDATKGIKAIATIKLNASLFLQVRQDSLHMKNGDTVNYEIYVKDKAGNKSNVVKSPDIYILP